MFIWLLVNDCNFKDIKACSLTWAFDNLFKSISESPTVINTCLKILLQEVNDVNLKLRTIAQRSAEEEPEFSDIN
jgi:hypothetical protein